MPVQLVIEVETATRRPSEATKKGPQFSRVPGWFEYGSSLCASLLVGTAGTLFRMKEDEGQMPLLSLEYLVSTFTVFEVTEPRDSIYSFLAIAKGTKPVAVLHGESRLLAVTAVPEARAWASSSMKAKRYIVDYLKPFINICIQFISFSINQSDKTRALDIICRPWAPSINPSKKTMRGDQNEESQNMPSWIPGLAGAAYAMYTHPNGELKMGRKNADSLVGLPYPGQRNYSAAESREIEMSKFGFKKREKYYSMYVSGFVLDRVAKVGVASQSGAIPEEWITLGGWRDIAADPPEEFWRTLVANRGRHGHNPPTYYSRALKESISKGLTSGALNTTELINDGRCSVISEFFRRVQAVIWNRSLMRTESYRLGIVHQDVQPDDLVCILYGCTVPVILRKKFKVNLAEENKLDVQELEEMVIRVQRFWRARMASLKLLAIAAKLAKVVKEKGPVAGIEVDIKIPVTLSMEGAQSAEKGKVSALVNGVVKSKSSEVQQEDEHS